MIRPRPDHEQPRSHLAAIALLYVGGTVVGAGLFVGAFLSNTFSFLDILFYRGLVIIGAAALLHAALLALCLPWMRRRRLSRANLVSVVAVAAMLNLTFFTLVPVNLDRSISVFLLAWMGNSNTPMTRSDLQDVFQQVYVQRYGAIDRRVGEQLSSGNIVPSPDGFVLTTRGRLFNKFARTVGGIFSVDPRFLNPHCTPDERKSGLAGCGTGNKPDMATEIESRHTP